MIVTAGLPTHYMSHGGGPWPYMEDGMRRRFDKLEASLLPIRKEWGDAGAGGPGDLRTLGDGGICHLGNVSRNGVRLLRLLGAPLPYQV
jgi:hypothetical protein